MFEPKAEIIADSINVATGDRLTTFVLTYHRFIHAEFMTYRMFSRNASSSRAIPVEKMIQKVIDDDVQPLYWGKNQKGMRANEELSEDEIAHAKMTWNASKATAISYARQMAKNGVHKQIVNRILEPFSSITVICTATDYQNFFSQRCHPDAQPEIQALAYAMRTAYRDSEPKKINPGEWHLPFLDKPIFNAFAPTLLKIKLSCACSARVSYLNHDGKRDLESDLNLFEKLVAANPPHLSPLEHPCMAVEKPSKYANLSGFQSYRYLKENNLHNQIV